MADLLAKFLRDAAAAPFAFGEWDCCMLVANWVRLARGGVDPSPGLRGSYSDDAGWRAIVEGAGGMAKLVGSIAAAAGLSPVSAGEERPGDIAVVNVVALGVEAGAVCVGPGKWVVKLSRGVTRLPATIPLAIWRP